MVFKPGQSGNPGGRPRAPDHVKEMLKGLTGKAVQALADALDGDDPKLRLVAAQEVLNRNFGKPHTTASVDVRGVDSGAAMLAALTAAAVRGAAVSRAPMIDVTAERAPPLPLPPPVPLAAIATEEDDEE